MGMLQHYKYGQEYTLSSQHLIGRAPGCHLRLDSPRVSGHHAKICWTGASWELCDLASTNGTYVDGRRLDPGERRVVISGSRLGFGHADDVYELISDDAPCVTATSAAGIRRDAREGSLLLPSEQAVVCMVYREGRQWFVDGLDPCPRRVESSETLLVGDTIWTLDLPVVIERTVEPGDRPPALDALTLRFVVSRDGENVVLELVSGAETRCLPPSVHWETMLILARERLEDRKRGISDDEAGWMDVRDLQKKLDIEIDALNQHVFRAKHALAVAGVRGHTGLVERRRVRKIRLGVGAIEIARS